MVVDTSAFVAILQKEATHVELLRKIVGAQAVMSAPNALEAHMVLRKFHGDGTALVVRGNLLDFGITIVPFSAEHAEEAARAFDRFGKGRHPAALDFGDCIAYALARVSGQPLLFTGDDFSKTDVRVA